MGHRNTGTHKYLQATLKQNSLLVVTCSTLWLTVEFDRLKERLNTSGWENWNYGGLMSFCF